MKKILLSLCLFVASVIPACAYAQAVNMTEVIRYASSYKSTTTLAVNTPDTIFAPGSNTKGAIIWEAQFLTGNSAGNPQGAFLAKASAPTTNIDGDVIAITRVMATNGTLFESLGGITRPVYIAPGKGLYYIASGIAETLAHRAVLYTLF